MTDAGAIHWESLGAIAGAFALAVWALWDPQSARNLPIKSTPALRLRIEVKNRPVRTVDVLDGARLGRGSDCEVVMDEPAVSKHHAQVRFAGRATIEDLGSTNGTYVNGRRIAEPTPLRRGDRIALGTAKIVFLGLTGRGSTSPKG